MELRNEVEGTRPATHVSDDLPWRFNYFDNFELKVRVSTASMRVRSISKWWHLHILVWIVAQERPVFGFRARCVGQRRWPQFVNERVR